MTAKQTKPGKRAPPRAKRAIGPYPAVPPDPEPTLLSERQERLSRWGSNLCLGGIAWALAVGIMLGRASV